MWKPDIVLKRAKRFNIKRTPIKILILKKGLKLGIVVLVMFNKMLEKVFLLGWIGASGRIPKTQSFNLCPFLTLSVRNGPSVSFGTNVPLNIRFI